MRDNNSELTVALVRKGANPNAESEGGLNGVIRATLNGDRSFLRMLVEAGADVNAFSVSNTLGTSTGHSLCHSCSSVSL